MMENQAPATSGTCESISSSSPSLAANKKGLSAVASNKEGVRVSHLKDIRSRKTSTAANLEHEFVGKITSLQ